MKKLGYIVIFILALIGMKFIAGEAGRLAGERQNANERTQPRRSPSSENHVVAAITRQGAEGVTKNDLTQEFLNNLESYMVQTLLTKAKRRFVEQGYEEHEFDPEVSAESVYVEMDGKKLAVQRVNFDNTVQTLWVSGIEGQDFVRVSCFTRGSQKIPMFRGPCSQKVEQASGVSVAQ